MRQAALTGSSVARFHQGGAFQPWLKAVGRSASLQRANQSLLGSADGSMATVATPRENKRCFTERERNRLDLRPAVSWKAIELITLPGN
jgi:hypothetical protein